LADDVELDWVTELPTAPARPADGHKGTFGTVVVVGGCETMPGAPGLTATAALRGGAGLVKLAGPVDLLPRLLAAQPSATGVVCESAADLAEAVGQDAVLAIGPGMGGRDDVRGWVMGLLGGGGGAEGAPPVQPLNGWRVVLDADGLNALAADGRSLREVRGAGAGPGAGPGAGAGEVVLTPHPGEFRRLAEAAGVDGDPTDPEARPGLAAAMARHHGAVVVLKGQHTIVSDGQRVFRNHSGNPALSTAGTGDVLTGLIASLMAQQMSGFEAAVLSVHVHGLAADRWVERVGRAGGMLAMELAGELPGALGAAARG
jgi:NAD(P)H-hydrate epimerase